VTTALTATAVRNARPSRARRDVPDAGCPGLVLTIEPTGSKRWALRYRRPDGRSARLVLGSVYADGDGRAPDPVIGGHLTLASARRLAAALRHRIAQGIDPAAEHQAGKQRRLADAGNTFGAAARDYVEQYAAKKVRRWKEQARLLGFEPSTTGRPEILRGGLADRWAGKPIASITGHDIHQLIDEVRRRGAPGLERRADGPTEARARAMLSCLSKMFSWLQQHRRIETNPCASVHRPEAPQSRDRYLNNAEIIKFWKATDAEPFGIVPKLLLLTGCRLNEVAGMRRSELSDDVTVWNIPGVRTKNRRPHVVPLPPMARKLIGAITGTSSDLIFTTTGTTPISGWSKIKRRLDKAMKIPAWRLHDLRRTFVTGCAELGIRGDVIELAVNHVSGMRGGIAGVYNKSELMPERRAALERWSLHVQGLVSDRSGNVVKLR
jgi:integrase